MNGADVTQMIQALRENAQRLGLTWQLRPATVTSIAVDGTVGVTLDGDTEETPAVTMTGRTPEISTRVFVISVPPAGLFIVGMMGRDYRARKILTAADTVTFTNIPRELRSLRLTWRARSAGAVVAENILMQVNSNTGANYYTQQGQFSNATVVAAASSALTSAIVGVIVGASAAAGNFSTGTIDLPGWDASASTFLGFNGYSQGIGTSVATFLNNTASGVCNVSGPYATIKLFTSSGNFAAGSDFQLEGLAS